MNSAFILQDILEQKSFFQVLIKRHNMQKLYEIAFKEGSSDSESCCTTQGLIARFVQQFNDRQKSTPKDDRWDCSGDDDDDIIVNEISDDDENEESKSN